MSENPADPAGSGRRFCLVASRYNRVITDRLVAGARDALLRRGARPEDIDVVRYKLGERDDEKENHNNHKNHKNFVLILRSTKADILRYQKKSLMRKLKRQKREKGLPGLRKR